MDQAIKPQYLLADSQLLFAKGADAFLPECLQAFGAVEEVSAVYIGASNGDEPAYFEIFQAAMAAAGVHKRHMIRESFPAEDQALLQAAQVILLAGGDVARGWQAMTTTGMVEVMQERYAAGASFIGVSAGSVQLGLKGWRTSAEGQRSFFETLGWVPFLVDCHDEAQDWAGLQKMVAASQQPLPGIGIPFGSGLVYHPDHSVQPLGKSLVAFEADPETDVVRRQVFYPQDLSAATAPAQAKESKKIK